MPTVESLLPEIRTVQELKNHSKVLAWIKQKRAADGNWKAFLNGHTKITASDHEAGDKFKMLQSHVYGQLSEQLLADLVIIGLLNQPEYAERLRNALEVVRGIAMYSGVKTYICDRRREGWLFLGGHSRIIKSNNTAEEKRALLQNLVEEKVTAELDRVVGNNPFALPVQEIDYIRELVAAINTVHEHEHITPLVKWFTNKRGEGWSFLDGHYVKKNPNRSKDGRLIDLQHRATDLVMREIIHRLTGPPLPAAA
eukprot:gene4812-34568_t